MEDEARRSGLAFVALALAAAEARDLRACAAPDNMPFSNRAGEGFENRIAVLVKVLVLRNGSAFIRMILGGGRCDAIIGMNPGAPGTETTRPYYRSGWVFVSRAPDGIHPRSFDDPALLDATIGLPEVREGNDTPPAHPGSAAHRAASA